MASAFLLFNFGLNVGRLTGLYLLVSFSEKLEFVSFDLQSEGIILDSLHRVFAVTLCSY